MKPPRQKSGNRIVSHCKTREELVLRRDCGKLEPSTTGRIMDYFQSNEVINDNDKPEKDTSCLDTSITKVFNDTSNSNSCSDKTSHLISSSGKYSIYKYDVDITSCKPCSVILERLFEENVQKLSSRNNLGSNDLAGAARGRYRSYKELKAGRSSKKTDSKKLRNFLSRGKPDGLKRNNSSDIIIESNDSFFPSCSNEKIDMSCHLLSQEKLDSKYCIWEEASRLDSSSSSSQIEHSEKNKDNQICGENSKITVPCAKQFEHSLRNDKIVNAKDNDEACRQNLCHGSTRVENSESGEEVEIQSKDSKTTPPMLKRTKPVLEEEITSTEGSGLSTNSPEMKVSPRKHSKISLEKENNTRQDAACRQEPPNKVSKLENSDQFIENNVLELSHLKLLTKRRLDETEGDESSICKLNKYEETQDFNPDHSKVEPDSLSHESTTPRSPSPKGVLTRLRSKNLNKAPIVRDVRVSLVKLGSQENSSTGNQDTDVEVLDCCTNTHESVSHCGIQILETRQEDLGQNCSNKTKDTKITDYFSRIDKSSGLAVSNSSNTDQRVKDSLLRKKYGISKHAVVLLEDFRKFDAPGHTYSVFKVKKSTPECTNSSIDINYVSTTANVPSFFTFHNNNLSCNPFQLSTNAVQFSNNFTNILLVDGHIDPSHGSLQTHTISTTNNLIPQSSRSLRSRRRSQVTQNSMNAQQTLTDYTNNLVVHDYVVGTSHIQFVPISGDLSTTVNKYQQANEYSPAKTTQDSLNHHSFVNTSTPGSRNTKRSSTSMQLVEDSLVNTDVDPEVPDEDLSYKKSPEWKITSHSSPTQAEGSRNHSSNSPFENATPKSSQTLNSELRLAFSLEKEIVLTTSEIPSNETQVHVASVNGESPETIVADEKSDDTLRANNLDVSLDGNKLQEKSNSPVFSKDSNTAEQQPTTNPTVSSEIKSTKNVGVSKTHPIHNQEPRHLPVNSMTILSHEMMEENSSWLGMDNTIDNLATECITASKNHSMEENVNDKTEASCNTITNENDSSTKDNHPDGGSILTKPLSSQSTDNVFPKRVADTNIETCSKEVSALTTSGIAQKEIIDVQHRDISVPETEIPVPNIPSLIPIPSVKDSSNLIPVECVEHDCENLNAQDEVLPDSNQEDRLVIDIDESDSESTPVEHILPSTSTSSCSNSTVGAVVQDQDAREKTLVSSRKECIICKKEFRSIAGLEVHLRMHLRDHDMGGQCIICDKRLPKKDPAQHYLEHCEGFEDGKFGLHQCGICKMKFRRRTGLSGHMKSKHDAGKGRIRSKVDPTSADYNKCAVCQLIYNSKEELFSHMLKHTSQEFLEAFAVIKAKQDLRTNSTTNGQNQGSDTPQEEKSQDEEQSSELEAVNDTLPASPLPTANFDVSICMCHKNERLETSNGVVIEIALTCMKCQTFFKTRKCFKDHYDTTSCKWSDEAVVTPTMLCNKCCMILNNLQDMHGHLTRHGDVDIDTKTSLLCRHCNIFFFGIGSLFYAHWSEHRKDPLFLADHCSFPKNIKMKVVETGGLEPVEEDESMERLFIADYQCENCGKPFESEEKLRKHLKSACIGNTNSTCKLICSMCNKDFIDKSTFDDHIEEHDSIKDFLRRPKLMDKSVEENQLTCSICKAEYESITSYEEHLIRHQVIQEKFLCSYCSLMMDSVEDFKRHSAEHKGTSVSCKVIFAISKFHCKDCKISLEDQSRLDEHLATHTKSTAPSSRLIEKSTTKIAPTAEKTSHVCATCQQEFSDQLKLDAHAATHNKGPSDHSIEDPVLIQLSEDSNSTDIEIIATKAKERSREAVVADTLLVENQETSSNSQESKKPPFLRVKNLKELLPYACSKCKAEFDTQTNLSKHTCLQGVNPTQDREFNYFCRICKSFPCDNDSDWNLHVLTHFPLQCSQNFSETWYHVSRMQSGQQIFKCKICPNYDSLTVYTMRRHFAANHPDIYHPVFKCRICHTFETEMEQEIRKHESSHFQKPSPLQPIANLGDKLLSALTVENSNNLQQPVSIPAATSTGDYISSSQPVQNLNNFQQPNLVPTFINLTNNLLSRQPAENSNSLQLSVPNPSSIRSSNNTSQPQSLMNLTNFQELGPTLRPDNNSNKVQQPGSTLPVTSTARSLPLLQPLQSFNNFGQSSQICQPVNNSNNLQQSSSIPSVTNGSSALPSLQAAGNSSSSQSTLWIPPVATSIDKLSSLQPLQSFGSFQKSVNTLQPDDGSNNFQLSIPTSSMTMLGTNSLPICPVDNSNKFRQPVTIPPVTGLGNNLPALEYFVNSQQPGPPLQSDNNPNNVQQSMSIIPATNASSCLDPLQTTENQPWLTTTVPAFQFQLNGAAPFNNMGSVMHTLPLYVANVMYCCRICKHYKCSSEQELKIHESMHKHVRTSRAATALYRCKLCENAFYRTEYQLNIHMETHHKGDQSTVSRNQTECLNSQQQSDSQFENSNPYTCQICSIGFLNEAFLHEHIRRLHPGVKLPRQQQNDAKTLYQCDTCGLLLISETTLSYHMKSHNLEFR